MNKNFVIKNKITGEYLQAKKDVVKLYMDRRAGVAFTNECADVEGAMRYESSAAASEDADAYCEMSKQDKSNYEVVEV